MTQQVNRDGDRILDAQGRLVGWVTLNGSTGADARPRDASSDPPLHPELAPGVVRYFTPEEHAEHMRVTAEKDAAEQRVKQLEEKLARLEAEQREATS